MCIRDSYLDHPHFAMVAAELVDVPEEVREEKAIAENPMPYKTYGSVNIDEKAIHQMDIAMRLPITVAGALMPDAHMGYGLPIGGVLAADNAVIPYGVGMDIGCRMCLTVYDYPPSFLVQNERDLLGKLKANTKFGQQVFDRTPDHAVFGRKEFKEIPFVKPLLGKARQQLGSSGSGNHFVEFCLLYTSPSPRDATLSRMPSSA